MSWAQFEKEGGGTQEACDDQDDSTPIGELRATCNVETSVTADTISTGDGSRPHSNDPGPRSLLMGITEESATPNSENECRSSEISPQRPGTLSIEYASQETPAAGTSIAGPSAINIGAAGTSAADQPTAGDSTAGTSAHKAAAAAEPGRSETLAVGRSVTTSSGIAEIPPNTSSPQKFSSPYQIGCVLTANTHTPSGPTPVTRCCLFKTREKNLERDQLSMLERCQKYPPLAGTMGKERLEFRIEGLLRTGDGHRAQLLIVTLGGRPGFQTYSDFGLPPGIQLVAKVLDPFFFGDERLDPFKSMDQFYTHETYVYQTLVDFQGSIIPRYYGSYSISLPSGNGGFREVRMILLEFIEGTPMSQLELKDFSQSTRQSMLRAIVEIESLIYQKNILLLDMAPRNIIFTGFSTRHELRLVFIDFGDALCQRYVHDAPKRLDPRRFAGRYISPLLRWTIKPSYFSEWIDWKWLPWIEKEFANTKKTITPDIWENWPGLKARKRIRV